MTLDAMAELARWPGAGGALYGFREPMVETSREAAVAVCPRREAELQKKRGVAIVRTSRGGGRSG